MSMQYRKFSFDSCIDYLNAESQADVLNALASGAMSVDEGREKCFLYGNGAMGRMFGKYVRKWAENLPSGAGVYAYLTDADALYIGRSRSGRFATLRERICETLRDERLFLAASMVGVDVAKQAYWVVYREWTTQASVNHVERAVRKANTTHVATFMLPDWPEYDLAGVEGILIEMFPGVVNRKAESGNRSSVVHEAARKFREAIIEDCLSKKPDLAVRHLA